MCVWISNIHIYIYISKWNYCIWDVQYLKLYMEYIYIYNIQIRLIHYGYRFCSPPKWFGLADLRLQRWRKGVLHPSPEWLYIPKLVIYIPWYSNDIPIINPILIPWISQLLHNYCGWLRNPAPGRVTSGIPIKHCKYRDYNGINQLSTAGFRNHPQYVSTHFDGANQIGTHV